ncbi:MAG: TolC family protein, partial [bacterium]
WQLFAGFGNRGRAKQAAAQVQEVQVQYRQAEEQAKLEVRKAQRAVNAANARIRVAQKAVEQATESHRIVTERYQQGLEKTSNLLDKEVALTHAKLRFLKARHDYAIALSELQFALGLKP